MLLWLLPSTSQILIVLPASFTQMGFFCHLRWLFHGPFLSQMLFDGETTTRR